MHPWDKHIWGIERLGQEAFANEIPISKNPYTGQNNLSRQRHAAWEEGWQQAAIAYMVQKIQAKHDAQESLR